MSSKEEKWDIPSEEWMTLGLFACKQMQALVMQALVESWLSYIGIGMY